MFDRERVVSDNGEANSLEEVRDLAWIVKTSQTICIRCISTSKMNSIADSLITRGDYINIYFNYILTSLQVYLAVKISYLFNIIIMYTSDPLQPDGYKLFY